MYENRGLFVRSFSQQSSISECTLLGHFCQETNRRKHRIQCMVLGRQPSSRLLDGLYKFQTAFVRLFMILTAFRLLVNFMIAIVRIFYYYSILGGLNWRNNHCTKYFHCLLMFPISWIIQIQTVPVYASALLQIMGNSQWKCTQKTFFQIKNIGYQLTSGTGNLQPDSISCNT